MGYCWNCEKPTRAVCSWCDDYECRACQKNCSKHLTEGE